MVSKRAQQQQSAQAVAAKPARPPPRRRKEGGSLALGWCVLSVAFLGLAVGAGAAYRYVYPTRQRCPAEGDRFYDHCKEGRRHALIKIDWECLGPRLSGAMRVAFGIDEDETAQAGVG